MSAALDTALTAVTEAGPEPAANDAFTEQARVEAIARGAFQHAKSIFVGDWDDIGEVWQEHFTGIARFAIAADPATAQLAILQGDKDHLLSVVAELRDRNAALQAECALAWYLLQSAVNIAEHAAQEWDSAPSGMKAGKIILALAGHVSGYRKDTDAIHKALTDHARQALAAQPVEGAS